MEPLLAAATKNIGDILSLAIKHDPGVRKALVVFDRDTKLSRTLEAAYRAALPHGTFLDFADAGPDGVRAGIDALSAGDFVGLVQSTHFRLDEFRVRIELFKRGLATTEHMHLSRMSPEQEGIYVDALAYDPEYYLPLGHALKGRLDAAKNAAVVCDGALLEYGGGFMPAKLNVGDYRGMTNVGGTFPIGEVFTEPADIAKVSGTAKVFAFAGLDHLIQVHEPFIIHIKDGVLVSTDGAPDDFLKILEMIRGTEQVLVREFGLGLNPAMHKGRIVSDITAFERMKGLHFSLGAKHPVYKKAGINSKRTRYHVDIFVDVERIEIDGVDAYRDGQYLPDAVH